MARNKAAKRIAFKKWMNKEGYKMLKIEGNRGQRRKKVAQEIHEGRDRRVKISRKVAKARRELGEKTRHEQIKQASRQQKAAKIRRSRRACGK